MSITDKHLVAFFCTSTKKQNGDKLMCFSGWCEPWGKSGTRICHRKRRWVDDMRLLAGSMTRSILDESWSSHSRSYMLQHRGSSWQ
jgi:hypothetical protein